MPGRRPNAARGLLPTGDGNDLVARRLEKVARLLEAQRADVFRVRAWWSAADRIGTLGTADPTRWEKAGPYFGSGRHGGSDAAQ